MGIVWPDTGERLDLFELASPGRLDAFVPCSKLNLVFDYSNGPPGHAVEDLERVAEIDSIVEAGRRLADGGADAVVWACTSGSFIAGLKGAEAQLHELRQRIGIPVTTGTLALISICRLLGLRSFDVLSPYPREISRIFRTCMEDAGLDVASMRVLHSSSATASASLELAEHCRALAPSTGEAVVIPDTAVNSLGRIASLEAAAGKPVLTVNQACLFEGAVMAGARTALAEHPVFRRLAERLPADPT